MSISESCKFSSLYIFCSGNVLYEQRWLWDVIFLVSHIQNPGVFGIFFLKKSKTENSGIFGIFFPKKIQNKKFRDFWDFFPKKSKMKNPGIFPSKEIFLGFLSNFFYLLLGLGGTNQLINFPRGLGVNPRVASVSPILGSHSLAWLAEQVKLTHLVRLSLDFECFSLKFRFWTLGPKRENILKIFLFRWSNWTQRDDN